MGLAASTTLLFGVADTNVNGLVPTGVVEVDLLCRRDVDVHQRAEQDAIRLLRAPRPSIVDAATESTRLSKVVVRLTPLGGPLDAGDDVAGVHADPSNTTSGRIVNYVSPSSETVQLGQRADDRALEVELTSVS